MNQIIEQIKKIKGVVTVETYGDKLAVVTFEPEVKPFKYKLHLHFEDGSCRVFNSDQFKISPKPEVEPELIKGEVYAIEYLNSNLTLFRFKKLSKKSTFDYMVVSARSILFDVNEFFEKVDGIIIKASDCTYRKATASEIELLESKERENK